MLFAGFNVSDGEYSLFAAVAVGSVANLVGSWIAYARRLLRPRGHAREARQEAPHQEEPPRVGRPLVRAPRRRHRVLHPDAARSSARSSRCPPASPGCRSGASACSRSPGCVPWVLMLTFIGKQAGDNWEDWKDSLHYVDYFVAAAIVDRRRLPVRPPPPRRTAGRPAPGRREPGGRRGPRARGSSGWRCAQIAPTCGRRPMEITDTIAGVAESRSMTVPTAPSGRQPGDPLDVLLEHLGPIRASDAAVLVIVGRRAQPRSSRRPRWFASPIVEQAIAPGPRRSPYDTAARAWWRRPWSAAEPLFLPRVGDWEAAPGCARASSATAAGSSARAEVWEASRRPRSSRARCAPRSAATSGCSAWPRWTRPPVHPRRPGHGGGAGRPGRPGARAVRAARGGGRARAGRGAAQARRRGHRGLAGDRRRPAAGGASTRCGLVERRPRRR